MTYVQQYTKFLTIATVGLLLFAHSGFAAQISEQKTEEEKQREEQNNIGTIAGAGVTAAVAVHRCASFIGRAVVGVVPKVGAGLKAAAAIGAKGAVVVKVAVVAHPVIAAGTVVVAGLGYLGRWGFYDFQQFSNIESGHRQLKKGQFAEALKTFENALWWYPSNPYPEVYEGFGLVREELEQYDEAFKNFAIGIDLSKKQATGSDGSVYFTGTSAKTYLRLFVHRGMVYLLLAKNDLGNKDFDYAIQFARRNAVFREEWKLQEELKDLETKHEQRGKRLQEQHKYEKARVFYRVAATIASDPQRQGLLKQWVSAISEQIAASQRVANFIDEYKKRQVEILQKEFSQIHGNVAAITAAIDNAKRIEVLRDRLDLSFKLVWYGIGSMQDVIHSAEQCITEYCHQVLNDSTINMALADIHLILARALWLVGEQEQNSRDQIILRNRAIEEAEKGLASVPEKKHIELLIFLGQGYMCRGEWERARIYLNHRCFSDLIALQPAFEESLENLQRLILLTRVEESAPRLIGSEGRIRNRDENRTYIRRYIETLFEKGFLNLVSFDHLDNSNTESTANEIIACVFLMIKDLNFVFVITTLVDFNCFSRATIGAVVNFCEEHMRNFHINETVRHDMLLKMLSGIFLLIKIPQNLLFTIHTQDAWINSLQEEAGEKKKDLICIEHWSEIAI